jgi:dipicolinate synthase subunit A
LSQVEGLPGELRGLTVAVVGGDGREIEIVRQLLRAGAEVRAHGLPPEAEAVLGRSQAETVEEATAGADVLLCPIPGMGLDGSIYAPRAAARVAISARALAGMRRDGLLILGTASADLKRLAEEAGIRIREYEADDELMILRAAAIAEGALRVAIEQTEITIHGARILLLGFGRIGQTLGRVLYDLRARAAVAARNPVQLARAYDLGLEPIPLGDMDRVLPEVEILFNTIPARLLTEERLRRLPAETVLIDLASPPGGIDPEAAKRLGLRAVWARGLGGRAPRTVGRSQWKGIRRIILADLVEPRRRRG